MNYTNKGSIRLALILCILLTNACSDAKAANNLSFEIVLVGSTPGNDFIKSALSIKPEKTVDFIRWELALKHTENDSKTFDLNIVFGESQPNTKGFKEGGEKLSLTGLFSVSKTPQGEIYDLKSEKPSVSFSLLKLNDNVFHLLSSDKKLLIGNGGWSYTLNRKQPLENAFVSLPSSGVISGAAQQETFDGRTPCLEIAKEYHLTVAPDCFKLKWRIILNRDPKTLKPTTFLIKRTNSRETDITGSWTIIKGIPSHSEVVIYRLDHAKPENSIYLWAADENVLFILHKNNQMFTGNEDFSFTLNKREP